MPHAGRPAQPSAAQPPESRVRASPLARRIAREAGWRLQGMRGSGPGGRILRRDVEAAIAAQASSPQPPAAAPAPAQTLATGWLTVDVLLDPMLEALAGLQASRDDDLDLDDLMLRAVATAFAHARGAPGVAVTWGPCAQPGATVIVSGADRAPLTALAAARSAPAAPDEGAATDLTFSRLGVVARALPALAPPQALAIVAGAPERRFFETALGGAFRTVCAVTAAYDPRTMSVAFCETLLKRLQDLADEPLLLLA